MLLVYDTIVQISFSHGHDSSNCYYDDNSEGRKKKRREGKKRSKTDMLLV